MNDQATTDAKTGHARSIFLLIAILFVASGFSSLIYQVVWTRLLGLIFGATTFAAATVLSIFMGGLAAGSYAAGRVADRIKRPFLWYGVLEGIIGLWALIAPTLFALAVPIYKVIWQHTHASLIPFSLLRFVAAAIILIVPTSCMGATLPFLARFVTNSLDYVGRRVGTLYSANTLGAVGGALTAGFVLLPALGLTTSTWIAAGINFLLMLIVLVCSRIFERQEPAVPTESEPVRVGGKLSDQAKVIMATFAISGALAMVYEVAWTRTLLLVIGSSTYAFTVMLSSFLIGIFLGSLVCARFVDWAKEPVAWFAALQMLLGGFTLISMEKFNQLPFLNLVIQSWFPSSDIAHMTVRFFLAGSVLIPTTLCLGAIFPLVVKACTIDLTAVGRSIGSLYSANTVGAIVGAFLSGFVFIPFFGAEKTLAWSAVTNFTLGVLLLFTLETARRPAKIAAIAAGLMFLVVVLATPNFFDRTRLLLVQSDERRMHFQPLPLKSFEDWHRKDSNIEMRFWEDGACSNVGVIHYKDSNTSTLFTNGYPDASDGSDTPTQSLIGGLPLLVRPEANDLAVIGWGSGQSVGAATLFPARSIEAIELEPAVLKAAEFFHHINHAPEKDARVHIQFNDGRNYLLATNEQFDLIISEPSNPWQSGVCNLFTREFMQICHDRLRPGGALAMWVQTFEVSPDDMLSILAALKATFSDFVVLSLDKTNIIVVASDQPLTMSLPAIAKLFENPRIRNEFAKVGLKTPESVISRMVAGADGLKLGAGSWINSDDRNKLEYDVGKSYESGRNYLDEDRATLRTLTGKPWRRVLWGQIISPVKALEEALIAKDALRFGDLELALLWANESNHSTPNSTACKVAAEVYRRQKNPTKADEMRSRALQLEPRGTGTGSPE